MYQPYMIRCTQRNKQKEYINITIILCYTTTATTIADIGVFYRHARTQSYRNHNDDDDNGAPKEGRKTKRNKNNNNSGKFI